MYGKFINMYWYVEIKSKTSLLNITVIILVSNFGGISNYILKIPRQTRTK